METLQQMAAYPLSPDSLSVVWLSLCITLCTVSNCFALQSAIEGSAAYADNLSRVGRRGALVDYLPCVRQSVGCQFRLAPELHAALLRGLHSGAGALND